MKVLVVGSGGREHTLVWKIKQSRKVTEVICAPGNGGIMEITNCFSVPAEDIDGLLNLAESKNIDLTIVGPEVPLVEGIVDRFQEKGLRIFGPTKKAAQIEGSKLFAKNLMKKYNIPTADYKSFEDSEEALKYIKSQKIPVVVKADGLAAGKGALVCNTVEDAAAAVQSIMVDRSFGNAGNSVVIEEFMTGEEVSIFVITDGKDFLMLPSSQDHKPVYNDDKGPNTGGMGAYAPAPIADDDLLNTISKTIIQPVLNALSAEGHPYKGLLYAGLMVTESGPKVVEFNCRFGDPETQVVVPLIENDLVELFDASIDETIGSIKLSITPWYSVGVVIASGGYPDKYEKGKEIFGLDDVYLSPKQKIFHAGTIIKNGKMYTNGGRVLCMNAMNEDLNWAIEQAYFLVESVNFEKAYYRTDIGTKGAKRLYQS